MGTSVTGGPARIMERDWQEWASRHSRELVVGAGIVVAVAAVWYLYVASAKRKEAFAAQALTQAWAAVEAGNIPLAANDLSRLVERFGGTRSAEEAAILLNELRLLEGETDVAVDALRRFLSSDRQDHVEAAAWSLLGGGLENQRKPRDAAEAYRRAAEKARQDFLKAQYLIDAGRAYAAAGDSVAARAAYGEVLERFNDLTQAAEARVRMAELGGTVPEEPKPRAPGQPEGST